MQIGPTQIAIQENNLIAEQGKANPDIGNKLRLARAALTAGDGLDSFRRGDAI